MRFILLAAILAAAVACSDGLRALAGPAALEYLGGIVIARGPGVGGLSGLSVAADGSEMIAISDFGTFVRAPLRHDAAGRLVGMGDATIADLGGFAPDQPKPERDSEALTMLPDGGWLVAFEIRSRILAYPPGMDRLGLAPRTFATPPALHRLPRNGGIEALAASREGTIVAIAEHGGKDGTMRRSWIGREGEWAERTYRTDPDFAPTGAAFLPAGDLLVLERAFAMLPGFRARLMLVPAEVLAGDGAFEGIELGRIAPPIGTDNFEGVAVRTGADGDLLVYIVSDDNMHPLQRTLLVQYRLHLPPRLLGRAAGG